MNNKDKVKLYDRDYFIGGTKSAYLNYLDQEKTYDRYWMKYVNRYGATAPIKKHLDIGCGFGVLVNKMSKLGWDSCGIDVSEFAIAEGKKHYGNININVGSADKLPFSDNSFGYITCLDVIEHLNDSELDSAMLEMYRCLKPGGVIFIATPNVIDNILVDIHSERYVERDMGHINYKSSSELCSIFVRHNFLNPMIRGSSPYIPQITEINIKNKIIRKIFNGFLSRVLYKFIGNNITYSSYLFLQARK